MKTRDTINVLVTLDSNYVSPLTVMLSSIMRSNPYEKFNLYVANSSLTSDDFARIRGAVDISRCSVISVSVSDKLLSDAPVLKRISKETYYRLIAADYLPEEVERVLYIDPDTVIINSLRDIYDMDMGDNLLAGSTHVYSFFTTYNRKRLNMAPNSQYVNAGVLLMNIEGLRKAVTSAEIFEYIQLNAKKLYLADQDVINALFSDRMLMVDERIFNLDEKTYKRYARKIDNSWIDRNTVVVHFNGKYKPWKDGYKGKLKCFYDREVAIMNSSTVTRFAPKIAG